MLGVLGCVRNAVVVTVIAAGQSLVWLLPENGMEADGDPRARILGSYMVVVEEPAVPSAISTVSFRVLVRRAVESECREAVPLPTECGVVALVDEGSTKDVFVTVIVAGQGCVVVSRFSMSATARFSVTLAAVLGSAEVVEVGHNV